MAVWVTAAHGRPWHVRSRRLRCRSANVESKQRANVARTLLQHMDSEGDDIDMKTLEVCPSPSPNLVLRVLLPSNCNFALCGCCVRLRLTTGPFCRSSALTSSGLVSLPALSFSYILAL